MKTNFTTMLRGALALAVLVVCGHGSPSQAALPVSPVGTWDFLLSGSHGQKGLAFLTFTDDGTNRAFSGFQVLVGSPTSTSEADFARNSGGEVSRNGFSLESAPGAGTILVGFSPVDGPWSYDSKGRVVGYFTELVNASGEVTNFGTQCFSNQVVLVTNNVLFVTNLSFCFNTATFTTNVSWTDPTNAAATFTFNNTNFTVGPSTVETTIQVSFVGKVSHGKHFNLKASTTFGNRSYKGVPYTANLKDLTGAWQAYRKQEDQTFLESFTLTSFGTGNPFDPNDIPDTITNFPNLYYTTNNAGPGYTNLAVTALSLHKKIAFVFKTDGGDLRSSIGPFSSGKRGTKADTKGIELPNTPFSFKAVLLP
jgi:hypothetical protein